tara:strand:+ start:5485 stop:5970 length:486 start_codon:yes stop_codon:yes gene_type:complete
MFIDSCLYYDFHKYIDVISINKNYFQKEDLKNISCLKSLYSCKEPKFTIHDYIDKIMKDIYKEDTHIDGLIINAVVLLKRVTQHLIVNNYNIHRLLAGVLMLSQKVYDDTHYNNDSWAIICGVQLIDINRMELDILQIIDYNTFIKHEEMLSIVKSIKYLQ